MQRKNRTLDGFVVRLGPTSILSQTPNPQNRKENSSTATDPQETPIRPQSSISSLTGAPAANGFTDR